MRRAAARAFERARPTGDGRPRRLRVALVVGAAVVATAVAAPAAAVVGAPVRATTAGPAAPEPVVTRPGAVRREWDADGPVGDLRAAGAGVVVAGGEAVTALDGPSGAVAVAVASRSGSVVGLG
ncbi:hypothetical protein [Pseudonocardia kunmingensis]|nr:hypothetical protein [Pseudonocardia kunmingensis]